MPGNGEAARRTAVDLRDQTRRTRGCGWLTGNFRSTRMSPSGTRLKFSEFGDSRFRRKQFRSCLGVCAIVWAQNRLAGNVVSHFEVRWVVVRSLRKKSLRATFQPLVRLSSRGLRSLAQLILIKKT